MRFGAGFAAALLALSLSSGCGPGSQPGPEQLAAVSAEQAAAAEARVVALERRAEAFVSMSKVWDPALVSAVVDRAHSVEAFRDTMFWVHHEVGACVRYKLVSMRGREMVRFEFLCQRGHVELGLRFNGEGQVRGTLLGIRGEGNRGEGIRAKAQVRRTQAAILGWLAWGQPQPANLPDKHAAKLRKQFDRGEGCYLGTDLLVGQDGALTLLSCSDRDDQILTIDLDDRGEVRRAAVVNAAAAG